MFMTLERGKTYTSVSIVPGKSFYPSVTTPAVPKMRRQNLSLLSFLKNFLNLGFGGDVDNAFSAAILSRYVIRSGGVDDDASGATVLSRSVTCPGSDDDDILSATILSSSSDSLWG